MRSALKVDFLSRSDYVYVLGNSRPQLLQIHSPRHSWYISANFFWRPIMLNVDEIQWNTFCADPQFRRYLGTCKDFDPVGIQRALNTDKKSGSYDFRKVIIEAYMEDCATGAIQS